MWTVSLHSALNEPIMGVYVALMRVSVRRETLHRSPPNQWGLACYTTTCFLSSSSSLITSVLPLSPPFSASLSLSLSFFLHSISKRWEWGFWPIGHEESFKRSKMRPSESCYAQDNKCKSYKTGYGIFRVCSKHFWPAFQVLQLLPIYAWVPVQMFCCVAFCVSLI